MGDERYKLFHGDNLEVMGRWRTEFVDAVITDPPAGINFMGKKWDSDKGGGKEWISWLAKHLEGAFRVLKPGGHILVWALPKTSHRTAQAIEKAGFEIRDRHSHFFGTGFPKNHNVSKAIDRVMKVKPTVVGDNPNHRPVSGTEYEGVYAGKNTGNAKLTAPTSPEAQQWEGWGTALKPACEDWWLARKPFKGTVAKNVLKHGTGAINIDVIRIGTSDKLGGGRLNGPTPMKNTCGGQEWDRPWMNDESKREEYAQQTAEKVAKAETQGRWPAHISFEHHPECVVSGTKIEKGHKGYPKGPGGKSVHWSPESKRSEDCRTESWEGHSDQEVAAYDCHPDCPIDQLDEQSGILKSGKLDRSKIKAPNQIYGAPPKELTGEYEANSGGASRFFYTAKPSKKERNAGLDDGEVNDHPTVKSKELMRWLVSMITPPNGVVLDPFMGSGSTGIACMELGFRFVGIDQDEHYVDIARKRIENALRPTEKPTRCPRCVEAKLAPDAYCGTSCVDIVEQG